MKMKTVLLMLIFLLGVTVTANASLTVVVKKPQDPMYAWQSWADSKLWINPSDTLVIGFADSTVGVPAAVDPGDVFYLGISEGPGTLDLSAVAALSGVSVATVNDAALAADMGIQNGFLMVSIVGDPISSMLAYGIDFHCEGPGDVTFFAYDQNFTVVDTQVIHQTPEPATLGLLGMGGVLTLLRKRKV